MRWARKTTQSNQRLDIKTLTRLNTEHFSQVLADDDTKVQLTTEVTDLKTKVETFQLMTEVLSVGQAKYFQN